MEQPKLVQVPGEPAPGTLRLIMGMGHALLLFLLISWVLLFYFIGSPYQHTGWLALTQLISGRAGAVGLGLNRSFSAKYMLYQVAMVDFILMLYTYPLFVRGYQHLTRIPVFGDYLENMHKVALSHKARMAPYGAMGLMIFVIFPFWSTGCMVGAIVGYLIGLPTWLSLSSVTVGNVAAIALWILFYERLQNWNPTVALILLVVILALAIGGILYARLRRKKKLEEEQEMLEIPVVKSVPPQPAPSREKMDADKPKPPPETPGR